MLAHWNNSSGVDMSLHSDILSWYQVGQSLLILLNAVCFVEGFYPTEAITLVASKLITTPLLSLEQIYNLIIENKYPGLYQRKI